MKISMTLMSIGVCLVLAAGAACAADEEQQQGTLPGVMANQDANLLRTECKPPAYARQCEFLHAQIRQNFSKREIVLLFGAASALAEYRTRDSATRTRYEDFLREIDLGMTAPATVSID
jgi:hypothetical protein